MVKADAYGHGLLPIAKKLEECGVSAFGVATVEEGIELRKAGIKKQILVIGGMMGQGMEVAKEIIQQRLTPVIHSPSVIEELDQLAGKLSARGGVKGKLEIHLQIDTGMSRLGVTPVGLPKVLEKLKQSTHLKLQGVMTHLAFRFHAGYTKYQTQLFQEMGDQVVKELGNIPIWHLANSAAVIEGEPITFSWSGDYWARPGIMLYGIPPYSEYTEKVVLKPVMSIVSKVALVKKVPKGTKVSYNCTFTAQRETTLGLIPIGYADGLPWSVSNKGQMLVHGKRCPVAGRVTMDMTMIDLTDCPEAKVGSDVVLLGEQGKEKIDADEMARWADTISYEIVCRVSKRMPRIYLS